MENKSVQYLIVDTTAFIQNAPLQEIGTTIITCPEVINEITNKRQLRRLVVLPYNLMVKEVFPENIQIVTDFSKKTGDYPSLSATDIKVIALTYQLEKEKVGIEHLRSVPVIQKAIITTKNCKPECNSDVTGFYTPSQSEKPGISHTEKDCTNICSCENTEKNEFNKEVTTTTLENPEEHEITAVNNIEKFGEKTDSEQIITNLQELSFLENTKNEINEDDILVPVQDDNTDASKNDDDDDDDDDEEEEGKADETGWITPSNIKTAKKQLNSELMEDKCVTVACMTTDFAMQNVLKQMNLNVTSLDGRLIKQLRTYILRCYSCFKTTSIMTKFFCPKCGNDTLKKVAVSLNENGKMSIHINTKKPLTARGKKFSLPKIKGGKHPNNPILVEDQPMPHNLPSKLARIKNNPLNDDYIAGFSPFVMRDVNSKSAQLCIRPNQEVKYWMRKNPNEVHRKRK